MIEDIDHLMHKAYLDVEIIAADRFLEQYIETHLRSEKTSLDSDTKKAIFENMEEKLHLTGPWQRLMVFDKNGFLFSSTLRERSGSHIKDYPGSLSAFYSAINGRSYFSDLVLPNATGIPTIIFSAPLRSKTTGGVLGVVIGHFA